MGNNCSSKICKTQRKNIIVEFIFSKVVNQKSEAVTNMERFLNVFLGILQNFLKLAKKIILTRSCFWSKYLDQNYHFHCQNLTNYNWNQCHFHYQNQCPTTPYFFCNSSIQSFRSVIVNDVCLFTETIDYSHTTEGWKFQLPLHISNQINMDHASVYPYSMHQIINFSIDSFNVLS